MAEALHVHGDGAQDGADSAKVMEASKLNLGDPLALSAFSDG